MTDRQTETERERDRERQTDRQTDRRGRAVVDKSKQMVSLLVKPARLESHPTRWRN